MLIRDTSRTVELGGELSEKATSTLLQMGLRERHSDLIHDWRRDVTNTRTEKDDSIRHWSNEASRALAADLGRLKNHIRTQVLPHVTTAYAFVGVQLNCCFVFSDTCSQLARGRVLRTHTTAGVR